jgi:hypothetical protein
MTERLPDMTLYVSVIYLQPIKSDLSTKKNDPSTTHGIVYMVQPYGIRFVCILPKGSAYKSVY